MELPTRPWLGPMAGPALGSGTLGRDRVFQGSPSWGLELGGEDGSPRQEGSGHAAARAVLWGSQGSAQQHLFLM